MYVLQGPPTATCGAVVPGERFSCPSGYQYDERKNAASPPSAEACCVVRPCLLSWAADAMAVFCRRTTLLLAATYAAAYSHQYLPYSCNASGLLPASHTPQEHMSLQSCQISWGVLLRSD
jgi:hypothetical protein